TVPLADRVMPRMLRSSTRRQPAPRSAQDGTESCKHSIEGNKINAEIIEDKFPCRLAVPVPPRPEGQAIRRRPSVSAAGGFRFSTNIFGLRSPADFAAYCRRVEELGYDALYAADHLGGAAPFQEVVAAAAVTSRIRVGTLVLNVPFWNPALLA